MTALVGTPDLEFVAGCCSSRASLGGVEEGRGGNETIGLVIRDGGGITDLKGMLGETVVGVVIVVEDIEVGCANVVNLVNTRVIVMGPVRVNPGRSLVV